jgi:mercuric ion binding protein
MWHQRFSELERVEEMPSMRMQIRGLMAAIATLVLTSASQAAERTITLDIENASCASCGWIIDGTLSRLPGVRRVDIVEDAEFTRAVVKVTFDDAKVTPVALITASTNAGYPATLHTDPAPAQ